MVKIQSFLTLVLLIAASHQAYGDEVAENNIVAEDQVAEKNGVINNIKDQVVNLIDKTTEEVKDGVSNLNNIVENTVQAAEALANNSTSHLVGQYNNLVDKVSDIYQSNSILSKECNAALDTFRSAYSEMVKKTNQCVDRRVQVGIFHLNKINTVADEAIRGLAVIRDEAIKCVSNVHGATNFLKALACINSAAIRATWFVGKKIPPLTLEMTKLGGNILLLPPQIGYCFSAQFISTIYGNYQQTLSKLNECIIPSDLTTGLPQTTLML